MRVTIINVVAFYNELKIAPVPWDDSIFRDVSGITFYSRVEHYCSIYFCHSAGTTSTAIRLLREGANSIAIGM